MTTSTAWEKCRGRAWVPTTILVAACAISGCAAGSGASVQPLSHSASGGTPHIHNRGARTPELAARELFDAIVHRNYDAASALTCTGRPKEEMSGIHIGYSPDYDSVQARARRTGPKEWSVDLVVRASGGVSHGNIRVVRQSRGFFVC
jgi:hypothetical protein